MESNLDLKVSSHPQHTRQLTHLRPYLERTPQHHMKHLLLAALTAVTLLTATTTSAHAHHDGDHKHQDTTTKGSKQ